MNPKIKKVALKRVLKRKLKDAEASFYFQRETVISGIARSVLMQRQLLSRTRIRVCVEFLRFSLQSLGHSPLGRY